MTKEEILNKHVSLYFSSHHDRSRWNGEGEHGGAEWHTDKAIAADIYKAMDEYAKKQSMAFDAWKLSEGWGLQNEEGHINTKYYHDRPQTFEELYNQFIEQQNK